MNFRNRTKHANFGLGEYSPNRINSSFPFQHLTFISSFFCLIPSTFSIQKNATTNSNASITIVEESVTSNSILLVEFMFVILVISLGRSLEMTARLDFLWKIQVFLEIPIKGHELNWASTLASQHAFFIAIVIMTLG